MNDIRQALAMPVVVERKLFVQPEAMGWPGGMPLLREAEKANIPFWAALAGALRRCSSLVRLATRRSERLALHPARAPKNGILIISVSLRLPIDPGGEGVVHVALAYDAVLRDMRSGTHEAASFADALARHKILQNITTAAGQGRRGQTTQSARK